MWRGGWNGEVVIQNKTYQMARTVLGDAAAIQPKNPDMLEMTRTVDRQILPRAIAGAEARPGAIGRRGNAPPARAMPAGKRGAQPAGHARRD